jgi:hypothetical protein
MIRVRGIYQPLARRCPRDIMDETLSIPKENAAGWGDWPVMTRAFLFTNKFVLPSSTHIWHYPCLA